MRARGGRKISRRALYAQVAYQAALEVARGQELTRLLRGNDRAGKSVRSGPIRNTARSVAMHLAREAYEAPLVEISRAAGCVRSAARTANLAVWERRDEDPELDHALWEATQQLKGEMIHG